MSRATRPSGWLRNAWEALREYWPTRVTLCDRWRNSRPFDPGKIHVGWCSVLPPSKNGAAAACYYTLRKLMSRPELAMHAIPVGGRVDKRLFPGLTYTTLDDPRLDVVVLYGLAMGTEAAARSVRAPLVVWQTIHDSIREASEHDLFRQLNQVACDGLYLTTRSAAAEYAAAGVPARYWPHLVDRALFHPAPAAPDGPFVVLYVSRLARSKGLGVLLDAAPIALQASPRVQFRFHAPDDSHSPGRAAMAERIAALARDFPGRVQVETGWVGYDALPSVYAGAGVLAFPSNSEGFGVPLIEAMACGVPCLVADKAPMNELVQDGVTGFCLPYEGETGRRYADLTAQPSYDYKEYVDWAFPDPAELADRIVFLATHPDDHARMAAAAVSRAAEYDLEKWVGVMAETIVRTQRRVS